MPGELKLELVTTVLNQLIKALRKELPSQFPEQPPEEEIGDLRLSSRGRHHCGPIFIDPEVGAAFRPPFHRPTDGTED
ncbi:MAG: hypothetical protein LBE49_09295 [Deltaproteobacteria bacterium]|nr:hypothetical protein [Deltaproteobacteria bacterium]